MRENQNIQYGGKDEKNNETCRMKKGKVFCIFSMIFSFIIVYIFCNINLFSGIELFVGYSVSIASAAALLTGFLSVIWCLRKE